VTAQVERDDPVVQRKLLQLVGPLAGLPAEAMQEHKCPLRPVGRDVDRRKPHQRIRGNTYFMPVEIQVDVHVESVQELILNVNFWLPGSVYTGLCKQAPYTIPYYQDRLAY
jgi:hypothetical protein